jgi:hypothetical protein
MLAGLRIKCIGFSVTGFGGPCYPISMENYFKKNGDLVDVSYASLGGLSIDSLPYLIKRFVKKDEIDLVILEISTSWFGLASTCQEKADKYIRLIINYLENMQLKIMFLNLYRKDLDDRDSVVRSIEAIAQGKYPILDFKARYRKRLLEENDDDTLDGVHPKPKMIEYISSQTCEFIKSCIHSFKVYPAELQKGVCFDLITIQSSPDKEHYFDNRRGLILPSIKVCQGEVIRIEFSEKKRISGMFFMWGPDTNQINLSLDLNVINIPMRDEMSFYRRLGYLSFSTRDVQNITIEHPRELMNVKLSREPWEKIDKIQNYIFGFSSGI